MQVFYWLSTNSFERETFVSLYYAVKFNFLFGNKAHCCNSTLNNFGHAMQIIVTSDQLRKDALTEQNRK